jgi:hypothetical protein
MPEMAVNLISICRQSNLHAIPLPFML